LRPKFRDVDNSVHPAGLFHFPRGTADALDRVLLEIENTSVILELGPLPDSHPPAGVENNKNENTLNEAFIYSLCNMTATEKPYWTECDAVKILWDRIVRMISMECGFSVEVNIFFLWMGNSKIFNRPKCLNLIINIQRVE
jgi:hypothetical protein